MACPVEEDEGYSSRREGGPDQAHGGEGEPHLRTHDGYEWLYVLRGKLRVKLSDQDFLMGAGEAAEFDCRIPHWFGTAARGSVEVLSLFGKQGERIHLRTQRR